MMRRCSYATIPATLILGKNSKQELAGALTLREHMQEVLGGWHRHVPEAWQDVFDGILPDLAVPELDVFHDAVRYPAYPGFRQNDAPHEEHHLFRAFDGLCPERVRVVVLGQDPYPDAAQATGRAFEDGAWRDGIPENLAKSLKPLIVAAYATRFNRLNLLRAGGWQELNQIEGFVLPEIAGYFNSLSRQGVLFVNAAWSRTQEDHKAAHQALWQPVTDRLIERLAKADRPVVFLLLGVGAKKAFCGRDWIFRQTAIVQSNHPNMGYDKVGGTILSRVNDALRNLGADEINWWPDQGGDTGDA